MTATVTDNKTYLATKTYVQTQTQTATQTVVETALASCLYQVRLSLS